MDEQLVSLSSSSSTHYPAASFFSAAAGHPVLEFISSDVPEQWLLADDSAWAVGSSLSPGSQMLLQGNAPPLAARRRGRKPGPRSDGPTISHVEAERQRRDKLNRRFCDLRAAVPTVSRMDKASLLADAAAYIAELRGRAERLEAEAKQAAASRNVPTGAATAAEAFGLEEKLEVRMVGREAAAVRLTTAALHAPARLMGALRAQDLPVQHACVSRVGAVTVQDAVVDVPAALQDEGCLRAALLHRLQES